MNDANPAPPASDAPAPPREDALCVCGHGEGLHREGRGIALICYGSATVEGEEVCCNCWEYAAASPAQEATPPREPLDAAEAERVAAMPREQLEREWTWRRKRIEELEDVVDGYARTRAAPTPEASAPEPDEQDLAVLKGRYRHALQMLRADGQRTYPDDIEAYVAALPDIYAIADATRSLRADNTRLEDENTDLLATVAALTAERTALQRQLQDQGRTEKSEPPTAAAPNQPQEPEPKGESPVCAAVMPRTTPPGCFVCTEPPGHADWHRCPMGTDGAAMWSDEP